AERMGFDFSDSNKNLRVSALAISPIDHNHWYVTTTDGRFFHSVDRGIKWSVTDSFSAPGSHYFYGSSIVPSETTLGELYLGGSGYSNPGVFYSTDHGKTFVARDSGLPKTLIYGMASTPSGDLLFAGTEIGPYVYVRETNKWYDIAGYSAPDHVYWSVEYIPEIKTVRFGTHGRGIWDFKIDEVKSAVASEPSTPVLLSSLTATKTSNGYSITTNTSGRASAKLRVYDLTGRMVNELYQGELSEGVSSFEWKTADAPSGVYLAVLNAGGNVAFTKLVVTK
ncbi:MAG TPA: T9SS type A sorting domain-containing protein, partial [Candidatus Kapabacteria bacterium]